MKQYKENGNREPEEWILTDEDKNQYRRKIADGVYELYQINERIPASACYDGKRIGIAHGVVRIQDIDIKEICETYGYEFVKESSDDSEMWYGILAECEFEMRVGRGAGYISEQNMTWIDAKNMIINLIFSNTVPEISKFESDMEDYALDQKMGDLESVTKGFIISNEWPIRTIQYGDVIAFVDTKSNDKVEYHAVGHVCGDILVPINLKDLSKVKAFASLL